MGYAGRAGLLGRFVRAFFLAPRGVSLFPVEMELPDDFAEKVAEAGRREKKTPSEMLSKIVNEWIGRRGKQLSVAPKGCGLRPAEKRRR